MSLALLLVGGLGPAAGVRAAELTTGERLAEATAALKEMAQQKDSEQMGWLLGRAYGVAIFPSIFKAGLGVGVRYGDGLVLRRDRQKNVWCGPTFVKIKGYSYGPQVGIQSTSLVLVIANEQGMKGFRGDKVTLGGDVTVAAGPMGRHAEASTDADLKASIYSYSLSKGMFAGASLEGSVITADDEANAAYWGKAALPDENLGRPATKAEIQSLLNELAKLAAKSGK